VRELEVRAGGVRAGGVWVGEVRAAYRVSLGSGVSHVPPTVPARGDPLAEGRRLGDRGLSQSPGAHGIPMREKAGDAITRSHGLVQVRGSYFGEAIQADPASLGWSR
jgi:hypothetical protein